MKGIFATTVSLIILTSAAFSAEGGQQTSAGEKQAREQMAISHEKMAQCLRTDQDIQDCHQQMREQCQGMKDDVGCFMMGGGRKGMRRNFDRKNPPQGK